LEVNPSELHRWRREWHQHGKPAFRCVGMKHAEQRRVAELERKVGQQALENDFLSEPCACRGAAQAGATAMREDHLVAWGRGS